VGQFRRWSATTLLLVMLVQPQARAYSVLTHEEIVDMVWLDQIQPLLKHRFPQITADQIKEAHAYAYGGAVMPDMGYYPFGSSYFSNLVHYVRSGDFVANLLKDSADPDEYAFALGALAHYCADLSGHPAVNRATAIEYPKLQRKFGPSVTYEEDKAAHIKVEFGFDVVQVAKERFAFDQYHSFIGFQVSKPLLERAFLETYGVPLDSVLTHEDLAIGTFRWSVSKVIPEMTKVALVTRGKQMLKEHPDFNRQKFLYRLSRTDYQREWGKQYQRPGFGARLLSVLLRIIPHIGPFKALKYQDPTPQTEDMYFKSVNDTITMYSASLKTIAAASPGEVKLADRDYDTGQTTAPGEYRLTDDTHARLLRQLAEKDFTQTSPPLREYLLNYYSDPNAKDFSRRHKDEWQRTQQAIAKLKSRPAETENPPSAAPQSKAPQSPTPQNTDQPH